MPRRRGLRGGIFVFGEVFVELAFEKQGGLIPAILQDHVSKEVLMLGYVNPHALAETWKSGEVHFFSRSRNQLWKKGETSGHVLRLKQALVDCDADALLLLVEPVGPGVCHEGYRSCFFRELSADGSARIIAEKVFSSEEVYGRREAK
ncbi:MAG TPA: phosphoribosyl-AMP cyclohydrolase [Candidatus Sulfotelmatobacter sp.]|jgi:phosphoribosyl-AMP cyclohydrolase|nr:phosphoribosyl-AMP cyclohydrolase [Candidatus Sulfotelmatobacter sp.]